MIWLALIVFAYLLVGTGYAIADAQLDKSGNLMFSKAELYVVAAIIAAIWPYAIFSRCVKD